MAETRQASSRDFATQKDPLGLGELVAEGAFRHASPARWREKVVGQKVGEARRRPSAWSPTLTDTQRPRGCTLSISCHATLNDARRPWPPSARPTHVSRVVIGAGRDTWPATCTYPRSWPDAGIHKRSRTWTSHAWRQSRQQPSWL